MQVQLGIWVGDRLSAILTLCLLGAGIGCVDDIVGIYGAGIWWPATREC